MAQQNLKEFLNAVTELRRLQKKYFRTHSLYVLDKCKQAEREVDLMLDKLNNRVNDQLVLF